MKTVYPLDYRLDVPSAAAATRAVPGWWHAAKRVLDVLLAASILLVTLPLTLAVALAILVVSPGPALFWQTRVGKGGRLFRICKFRTMSEGAHLRHEEMKELNEVQGPVLKIRNDPRLHALGSVLRRTSIDELPNFINVLRGEMSIVGPRPPLPSEVEHYDGAAMRRLSVKPGVTCLWQISGRSNVSFQRWIELDNRYIDTWSPLGDLAIVAKTIPAVLRGDGAH